MSEAPAGRPTERMVYLNGDFLPESEARLSIFDRGFIWGDAVYDVYNADEAFLTAGTFCVLPVGSIDRRPLNESAPGPVTKRILDAWSDMVGVDIVGQIREQARSRNLPA